MGSTENQPLEPAANERLDSWKEIAAYLKRDERTVRRWEKGERLPVRRHVHKKQASVYAYRHELDAWWNNRRPQLEQEEQSLAASRRRPHQWWALAGVAAVTVAIGAGLWFARAPGLPFQERDWVLIAQFENRTGEEVFDGTLEYALERELSNSRYVNVVPRERINDTLQLMKKPLDTPISATLGRELALRDGGIRALLAGRVEKLDTTYVLSTALVNPNSGVTVASFSEEAVGQKAVVPAVRHLSRRVREALGEELASIQLSEQKLADVTTPSLRALQLYSQADALIPQGKSDVAEELLQQAVSEDPEFASAYNLLAWAISNQRKPEAAWRTHAQRALSLSEMTTPAETYFIQGSYFHRKRQYEQAMAAYEALLQLYPDHYWGNNNLMDLHWRFYRARQAVPYAERLSQLRPNSARHAVLASSMIIWAGEDYTRAKPYVLRARDLYAAEGDHNSAQLLHAKDRWMLGDLEGAEKAFGLVIDGSDLVENPWGRTIKLQSAISFYLALGKLEAAKETAARIPAERKSYRRWCLALVAREESEETALRAHLRQITQVLRAEGRGTSALTAITYARAGLYTEATEFLRLTERRFRQSSGTYWFPEMFAELGSVVEGIRALERGQTERALELLERARTMARRHQDADALLPILEFLSIAYERQGQLERAAGAAEEIIQNKGLALWSDHPGNPLLWVKTHGQLADLYRKQNQEGKALEMDANLAELLAYADPDHPILLQLRATQALAAAQPPN